MVGESFHPSGCWGEDSNHTRLGATVQKLLRLFAILVVAAIRLYRPDRADHAFGFLLQWPKLLTPVMFPVLVWIYVRLARSEERDALAEFGEQYAQYAASVPALIPKPQEGNSAIGMRIFSQAGPVNSKTARLNNVC
jgi:hypothetical protein